MRKTYECLRCSDVVFTIETENRNNIMYCPFCGADNNELKYLLSSVEVENMLMKHEDEIQNLWDAINNKGD